MNQIDPETSESTDPADTDYDDSTAGEQGNLPGGDD